MCGGVLSGSGTTKVPNSKIAAEHPSCKTIHFIRHAEGHHNVADRKHGTEILTYENSGENFTDARLTENGIRQSRALKSRIEKAKGGYAKWSFEVVHSEGIKRRYLDIDAVVTSTLSRTIETAFYGLPVTSGVSFFATELGRERIAEYMCEKRAT